MVDLSRMERKELLEVIAIKDQVIRELREEIKNYQLLLQEINEKK